MIQGLRSAIFKVNDLEEAKRWYTQLLGFGPYFDEPFYVGYNVGGFELGLDPDVEGVTVGNNVNVYWGVSDAAAKVEEVRSAGIEIDSEPQDVGGGIIVATVRDPFGNVIGFIQNPHFDLAAVR